MDDKGHTLPEIVIVIAVIGLIALWAGESFLGGAAMQRAMTAAAGVGAVRPYLAWRRER